MNELDETQQAIDRFFETRESPSQSECDDHARKISGGSAVQEVAAPGSLSYTVLCRDCPGVRRDLIVSFRQPESTLDQAVIELAKSIHGALVPEATFYGEMPGSNPPLLVYTMPCLQGVPCLEALSARAELNPEEKARHTCFVKHLASLPALFKQTYPQVLTHNDFSQRNILVNEDTFEITGIVDWSLARVLPFGMELDTLLLSTDAFWDEFWARCRIYDDVRQQEFCANAMQASKIGAVLHYAFQRNADGSPFETIATSKWALKTVEDLLLD
ncbi:hypothetical protein P170DRAFT_453026 [Aspergillus steynii IBT 23096]|uniref:Aminoglycoside phosphotransferase domain-containing protein n=1 Tax=Aspergillus steynii IBT 23096 TaxID=1392250 RepID=A0A2I2GS99_9EURO|nr:uncharacterized protein P170DRAFT_453026 [Aspergillus steynii IBT 23096]PLB55749.1 hypothetical protein P170DRAFT_453026 [Aspergillus steynii IBT 23096]